MSSTINCSSIKRIVKPSIPVIDIGNLFNLPVSDLKYDKNIQEIASNFGEALHHHGFAYLTNHGIPEDTLPAEIKLKYAKGDVAKNNHGYLQPGGEKLNAHSFKEWKEIFDISNTERFYPTEHAPGFQSALEGLENAFRLLDTKLLRLLAMALGLEDLDFFYTCSGNLEDRTVPSGTVYRTLFYPPLDSEEVASEDSQRIIGCGEHTDWGILSLLMQDSVGGLEVKNANNEWVSAKPIPNTIIVNTGDLLEAWTGGYFPATPHRVHNVQISSPSISAMNECEGNGSSAGNKNVQPRQSIGFFLQPDDHIMISPLKSNILSKPYHLKPLSAGEHFRRRVTAANKGY